MWNGENEDNLMFCFWIRKKIIFHTIDIISTCVIKQTLYFSCHYCVYHNYLDIYAEHHFFTQRYSALEEWIIQKWGISGWGNCFSLALPSFAKVLYWPSCNSTPISSSTSSSLEAVVMLALQKNKPRKIQLLQLVYQNVSLPLTAVFCGIY